MHLLEMIGDPAGADQRQNVHLARFAQHGDDHRAAAVDGVDDTLRESSTERLQDRLEKQHAELRRLEQHGVANDERGSQSGKGLVEWIIVRTLADTDAEWRL